MSRAMGSLCVFTCWGAASWHGGRVMLVLGARAAAGAGSCPGVRGSAPFGVVVVCGCSLVTVLAGGVAPVCGSVCGRWWALSWREVCGVSRGGASGSGRGVGVARLRSCVGGLWCPMSPGGGGGCGAVWWCCVVWWPSRWGGGGHRVQVSRAGLSPVAGPLAVWGSPARSPGRPPGVFQYVGRAGSVWRGAWGPLGRGVWDWSVATRGVWSCGAWGCRPTVEWAQWCGERRVWATRGLLRLRGPRVGGSRHLGRVVAPVRRPRVVSGGVWLGCIVSTLGGGLFARVWGGPVVGCRLVAGVGASLWLGLPRCPLGASRGRLWSAG